MSLPEVGMFPSENWLAHQIRWLLGLRFPLFTLTDQKGIAKKNRIGLENGGHEGPLNERRK